MAKQPDYRESLRALRRDPRFAPLVRKHGYPDLSRYHAGTNIFQSLLRAIIFQQISGSAARAIHARVLALFPTNRAGRRHPTPEQLQSIDPRALRAAGLSEKKVAYVQDLSSRMLDGTINEKRFPRMNSQEIIDHLVVIKGIGEWTAQMMLIFRLHRLDVLPVDDLAIRKGFRIVYGLKKDPTKKDMERIAKPWRAHASVAAWYLWREMDATKPIRTP